MKRKLLLFALLMALFAPWAAQAQNELTVYDGTTTSYYVPAYMAYFDDFSRSQFVIPADDLAEMNGGTISSIKFYTNSSNVPYTAVSTADVYLMEVDYTSMSAFEPTSSGTIVYQGFLDVVAEGEGGSLTIEFDTPYTYGGGNLLVGIENTTDAGYKFIYFYGQTVTGASGAASNGSSLSNVTFTQRNFIPKTTFTYISGSGPNCDRPETVTADDVTSNSATINWAGGSGTYNVEYKKTSDETWTSVLTNSSATSVELTDLTPGTMYQAKVQSVCVFDDTTLYRDKSVSFRTMYGIPLIEEFPTTSVPADWNRYSGLLSDVMGGTALTPLSGGWYFGASNGVFDSHARVNIYGTSCRYWLVTPSLLMENNVELSFEVAYTAYSGTAATPAQTGTDDKFVVLINNNGTWEILRQWDNAGSEYVLNNLNPTPLYVNIDLSSYAGQNIAVAFYCESTASNADNNLHIDNVSIDYIPSCPKPSGLAYSEVTGHTALLTWTPNGVGQTQWQICLNGDEENLQLVTSTDGSYTLTGLTGVTPYTAKVRAFCSEEDQSPWSNQVSFTTDVTCVAPTAFTTSDVTNRNVKLSWTSEGTDWIVAYKLTSAPDSTYVEVPVTENPYILEGLAPETGYTVKVRNNCGEVDGLSTWTATRTFTTLVAYPAPINVTVDSVFAYTAYLSWDELGTAMDWEVAYKLATDTAYTIEPTPENHPFILGVMDPLSPGKAYVAKVRSFYWSEEGDTTSAWSNEVPFTTLLTCPAPTEVAVIDSTINAYGATLNWHSHYSDSWNVKYREPAYVDNPLFQEGFNGTSIPTDWTQYVGLFDETTGTATLTSGTRWNFGSNNGVFDSHARTNVYSTYQAWLVTPSLTIGDNIGLSFDVALTKYSGTLQPVDPTQQLDDKFIVMISTDERATWTILRKWDNAGSEYVYNNIACTENGENVSIDLSSYAGQTVYIAFYGESTVAGGDNNLHIDNVAIGTFVPATAWQPVLAEEVPFDLTGLNPETYYEVVVSGNCSEEISEESASVFFTTKPSCQAPTELTVDNESVTAHAATLSWTENGSATEWVIEYTAIVDENAVTETINVTENPYTLTGLLAETPYAVKVKAFCGQGDESQWSNTARFTTTVACPAPTELAVDEESITANGATLTWNGTSDNYIIEMADLSAATTSEEVVEAFSENFEGGSVPAGWTNEGDASWTVGTGDYSTTTGAHGGTYNAKINHGTTGNVTYFVSPVIDLSAYANAKLSCWYVNRQWVSDIDGFGVYYRLGNGEWNELFSTTAAHSSWTQLSQLALPSESNVQLGFKFTDGYGYGVGLDDILIEGNSFAYEWTTFDSEATSPYTFEDLTPGTEYMVRVIGDCGEEGESVPSAAISFTTVATCVVPTDFAATDVTAHTATLVWNGENDSYVVNYRVAAGTQDWINVDFENGLPDGWTNEGASSWSVGTGDYTAATGAHGGSYNALINHGTTGDVTYLVSPAIDLSEQSDLSLKLWYINRQWVSDIDGFGIYYRIDGGAWNEIFATTSAHSSWTEFNQALPAGAYAANCQFGFKFTDGYGYGVGLDDINISIPTPAGEWMTATANENTVVLSGLVGETTYEAMVQAVCSGDDSSAFTDIITFTTEVACPAVTELAADTVGTHEAVISWVETGEATAWQICLNGDEDNLIEVTETTYTMEGLTHNTAYAVKVRAYCGEEDGASAWRTVNFHTEIACHEPTNLVADNIAPESATLMWEGESESYVVQYRPWEQVGDDQAAPSTMTTFTYDLSDYSGMGSIAIRHYNISDIFSVNVDDIVVTNAQDEVVFSEDFEGGISSAISIMDLDGDGYTWSMGSTNTDSQGNPTGNGNYYVTSSSYDNNVGALTPDNWLVISGVELGGQLTLVARAQDPEWTGDNFGVFVSAEEGAGEEIVDGDTQIDLWDLTPNTSYAWQVKGVCGEDESQWVSSFFTTLDDYLTFVTDGDWNDANNWNPAEVPTTDKNVHIQANAIIPAGVVAEANNVTIESGSITIKDGGQMKLNSQAEVVMEKEITGYGEGNGNYYLIASPFTGRTQFGASTWSHVDSLIYGTYDLYTFDRYYGEDEEWVNYKAHPEHIAFQSEAQGNQGLFEKDGYLYANQNDITLVFTGKINKSIGKTETKAVVYDSINRGWALVGNIYACNAYLTVFDGEGDMLEANYYVMNAAGDDFELAETANGIAPMTAAFVNFGTTGEQIQISSEEPNSSKYGRTGKFIMNLNQEGNTVDKAVLRFGKGLNLEKMSLKNNSKLYFSNNDKDYAVVYSSKADNMPVNFKAETAGSYTISFAADGVSFKELVLVDNVNNTKVDLLANPSYTFETEAGEFAGRFTIVYRVK